MKQYIPRSLEIVIHRAAREFPVVILTGPRQSGKTTLLNHLFSQSHRYLSLDPPDIRAAAVNDPRGFLEMYSPPIIFDECQYAPQLFPYIKAHVDKNRETCGQFLLPGSQNLQLLEPITESLVGRAAILKLFPFSQREAIGNIHQTLPWEGEERECVDSPSYVELWKSMLRGYYPELVANPSRDIRLWHSSYVQTYLERDVRSLRQIGDLTQFQNFVRALAARSAQLLQITDLARDLGLSVNTIKAWLSVMEATYQIVIVRPYFANIGKRLVKTPKIYFTDVGILCYLTGLHDFEHAAAGPMGGAIFETAVLSELWKTMTHQGIEPRLYFWRTSAGSEVDFLVEHHGKLIPIEVKLSATPNPSMATGIRSLRRDMGNKIGCGYVVHPGTIRLPLGSETTAIPFADL
ncbi:MAG: ATP-binding protein [Candidatus Omnitrophota bacterium]|jgi:predicted AAA+ superfamily ATPase|nr:MAG: ATP-binding protein [Candidatus Omnitrophota bacterium]